jgi:drug/metabolite transporter (DMT)-like permease
MNPKFYGLLALLGFAGLSAARDVYAHALFTSKTNRVDPVFFTLLICAVTFVVFYIRASVRDGKPYNFDDLNRGRVSRYAQLLNVATLVAYLTTFLAIDRIDAYSNALVDYGATPLVTAALGVYLLHEPFRRNATIAMILCLGGIGLLTYGLAGRVNTKLGTQYALGLMFAVISCVAASLGNVWNKRLVKEEGVLREKAIVIRMPLAILVLGIWIIFAQPPLPSTLQLWINLILLSFFGVSIPSLLVVIAFESLRLRNLAFAFFMVPVFAYIGSLIYHHVEFSWLSILAGFVVLLGVVIAEAPQETPPDSVTEVAGPRTRATA